MTARSYRSTAGLVWTTDQDRLVVVHPASRQCFLLSGLERELWQLLCLDYPYQKIVELLAIIQGCSAAEMSRAVEVILADWAARGIVQEGHGEPVHQHDL